MKIWITGASSGIGAELAMQYAQLGHTVYASARNEAKLNALEFESATLNGEILALPVDVTDTESVNSAVATIKNSSESLDLIILNAGYYEPIELDNLTVEHFEKTYDVNLRGVVRCLIPALAQFKQQNSGHIAIVSSIAGERGLPRAAAYGSSKAALIHLAESIKLECHSFGITVSLIEPGFVKSPLTDKNSFNMPFIMNPDEAAARIIKGIARKHFCIHFPKRFTLWFKLLKLLPYSVYFALTKRLL